jgi:hypothetical protein
MEASIDAAVLLVLDDGEAMLALVIVFTVDEDRLVVAGWP